MMDILEIRKYLPHRYPFLLIDRVVELVEGPLQFRVLEHAGGGSASSPLTVK